MEIDSIDFEEVNRIASPFVQTTQPLSFYVPASSESTIAPAAAVSTSPICRPVLPKPKNAIYNLANFNLDMEETTSHITNTIGEDLRHTLAENKKISEEKHKAVEQTARETQSLNTWSTLSHVAGYVLSIGSVMTGSPFLMASGMIGLASRTLHDTHLIDSAAAWMTTSEELQEKIIKGIDGLAVALQTGFALSGGILAWQAGTFVLSAAPLTFLQNTASALTTAGGIAAIASQVGMSIHQNKIAQLRAEMKLMDGDMAMQTQDEIPRKTKKMIEATEYAGIEAKMASGAIDLYR